MKRALIVIDMQNDFVFGALGSADAQAIFPNVSERVKQARQNGEQVIFTRDTHHADYMDTQEGRKLPVMHCIKDTDGWQIHPEVWKAGEGKTSAVIDKPTFGSIELADFAVSGHFKMMMYRAHLEYSLMGQLKANYLQNYRKGFKNIQYCKKDQEYGKLYAKGKCYNKSSEQHRARISHKHLCGIEIPHQKSKAAACKCSCKYVVSIV